MSIENTVFETPRLSDLARSVTTGFSPGDLRLCLLYAGPSYVIIFYKPLNSRVKCYIRPSYVR